MLQKSYYQLSEHKENHTNFKASLLKDAEPTIYFSPNFDELKLLIADDILLKTTDTK